MSCLDYDKIFLLDINSIINFDISTFYKLDFLINPYLRKDIDLNIDEYKKNNG